MAKMGRSARRRGRGTRLRGKERVSSHSIQIAQQNRSTGEPTRDRFLEAALSNMGAMQPFAASKDLLVGRGELYSVLPPDEHATFAKRGEAQGGRGRCAEGHTIRHVGLKRLMRVYLA